MNQTMAVVLAAGKGTRMQSERDMLPKVLRKAAGKPLLHYVLSAISFLPKDRTVLVTGYRHELVEQAFPGYPSALQEPQLGTGHAVQCAQTYLDGFDGTVLVCYGDMPLLRTEVYQDLLAAHQASGAQCTLLAGTCEEYLPYGRVLQDADGNFLRVVEDRDCTPTQKQIRDLNAGIYCFDCQALLKGLSLLRSDNAQKEYYLTDVPELIRQDGGKVSVFRAALNEQIIGVNTPEQLLQTERYLAERGE